MKKKNGFSTIVVILVIVVAGFIGWYIWQNQKPSQQPLSSNTTSSAAINEENLSLDTSKLPEGWSAEIKEPSRILLKNAVTKCFADVLFSTDTAESNSAAVDQDKQTVDAIKSKGYTVEELPKSRLTMQTASGETQLDAQVLKMSGLDNPLYQNYAYITKSNYYTEVQLSCPDETNFPAAKTALLAITLNR